jgi:hypothetical protein
MKRSYGQWIRYDPLGTLVAMVTWLEERSVEALTNALRRHAPELADRPIDLLPWIAQKEPKWWGTSAIVGGEFVTKFAWSKQRAEVIWREAQILGALGSMASRLRLIRRLLTKYHYPPDKQEAAVQLVMQQAELLAAGVSP